MRRVRGCAGPTGGRRITIGGQIRRLNELACQVISDYLTHRRPSGRIGEKKETR